MGPDVVVAEEAGAKLGSLRRRSPRWTDRNSARKVRLLRSTLPLTCTERTGRRSDLVEEVSGAGADLDVDALGGRAFGVEPLEDSAIDMHGQVVELDEIRHPDVAQLVR